MAPCFAACDASLVCHPSDVFCSNAHIARVHQNLTTSCLRSRRRLCFAVLDQTTSGAPTSSQATRTQRAAREGRDDVGQALTLNYRRFQRRREQPKKLGVLFSHVCVRGLPAENEKRSYITPQPAGSKLVAVPGVFRLMRWIGNGCAVWVLAT